MTAKELYKKHKGKRATIQDTAGEVSGIIVGYDTEEGELDMIIKVDEGRGWESESHDFIEEEHKHNDKGYFYAGEIDIVTKK